MNLRGDFDVIITGGGMAGLTCALQLKQARPGISILVLEKRKGDAPAATHKVGESFSELAAYYMRDVLGLKEYLMEHQLRKFGFRYFFSPEHSDDITRRVEVGSKMFNPFQSHQVDRGLLENELVHRLSNCGVDIVLGAKVSDMELSKNGHTIRYVKEGEEYCINARWIVDSTGRSSLLKRKLGLQKDINHDINASWFRLDAVIDIDHWSDNLEWRNFVYPGLRRLATNHLMGEGYWVWIIPLIEGRTSIGIVADPAYHPFDSFNTFEKAMKWLEKHEPHAARMFGMHKEKLMDFKVMNHFAYDSKQFFSADRWSLTGEAGACMDAFYSPGLDFIALDNSWITELIVRDLAGEDITLRSMIYNFAHKELVSGWISVYRNMYGIFGKTQIMLMKIIWDWASYWAIPHVLFANKGYTDIAFLKQYSASDPGIGRRFANLNTRMQELFTSWGQFEIEPCSGLQLNVFDLSCLHQLQSELGKQYKPGELMPKIKSNLVILEQICAEIFRMVSARVNGTPGDMNVDPYTMMLEDGKDELLEKSKSQNALSVSEEIKADIAKMWFSPVKTSKNEFA